MASSNTTKEIETLAAEIGDKIYIDVAKWHLYLSDARLHTAVAERVYPLLEDQSINEDKVLQILKEIPIKLGGGRKELPLVDLLPMQCQVNLIDLLEDYQRKL
ncbi:MAG: thylakoid-associated protein [Cyanobacteria bacterium QS_9_48_30]|nr:MAG: thylakoid-associated protein [Cyanobacteria bacterium QS_9_48_30]